MRQLKRSPVALLFTAVAVWSQPDNASEKARRAGELVVAGRPEEAIPIYQELARTFPKDAGMLVNLSIAEFKARRYRDAAVHAEAAVRLDPGSQAANLFLGSSYTELGQYSLAVAPLEKVIAAHPEDRNARLMLGEALLELDREEEAQAQFARASELAPENPKVWYGLGRSFETLSRRASRQLEATGRDSAYCHALKAATYLQQRRYGSAFVDYRKALEQYPALRGIHTGLASIYSETGHADWARIEQERESELPPPACRAGGLECDFIAGRYREIAEVTKTATSLEALFWASKAYAGLACQAYRRLSQLPPSRESHLHAAETFDAEGKDREAAREWRRALESAADDARTRTALAWSLFRARDYEEALLVLREVLNKEPDSGVVNFLCGATLTNLEQPQQALPYLEKAVRLDGQFSPARAALGQALLRAGKAAQAIPHLRAALAADRDGSVHFQLLRAYQLTGQTALARQALAEYQRARKSLDEMMRMEQGVDITQP